MARVVLSDASPLIGLSRIGGVEWLHALFGDVILPRAVRMELRSGVQTEPGLVRALEQPWLVTPDVEPEGPPLPEHLGKGEQACIRFGLACVRPPLLLMDDRLARREATARGLAVAGTAKVIGLAKRAGLIPSARVAFEALLRSDFRIAPSVIAAVLHEVERS